MASVIALIGMIDATRASLGSDAYGSWISCVGLAPLPPWFTVYRSRRHRLDGASLCAFKMCQGERRGPLEAVRSIWSDVSQRPDGPASRRAPSKQPRPG